MDYYIHKGTLDVKYTDVKNLERGIKDWQTNNDLAILMETKKRAPQIWLEKLQIVCVGVFNKQKTKVSNRKLS